jgi:hypothetical protein
VGAADYVIWRKGTARQTDYNTRRANFGESLIVGFGSGSSSSALPSVSEPATLAILLLGVLET